VSESLRVKIYYEDTDCGGVVYYANYLRYFERARTEFLEARGIGLKALMEEGIFFVVTDASLKYLAPARYGDVLLIETAVEKTGPASLVFAHRVRNEETGKNLVEGSVKLGCTGHDLKPIRLRPEILKAIKDMPGRD
jgi:acyl-CoA thioester hydrolase